MTLGPRGRNVVLAHRDGRAPTITNDGVTIAGEIELGNTFTNQGALFVRHVAAATNEIAGDGTTTATVLAQAIVRHGITERRGRRRPDGAPARDRAGRRAGRRAICARSSRGRSPAASSSPAWRRSRPATRRSGDVIADAIEKVGNDGALSVQDGQTVGIELELTDGMRFDRGWLSQEMVTDEARTEAVLDYPFILLADQKLASGRAPDPGARPGRADGQAAARDRRDDRGRRAADARHEQAARRPRPRSRSSRPEFGERRKRVLEDIAILTGGEPVTEDLGPDARDDPARAARAGEARRRRPA